MALRRRRRVAALIVVCVVVGWTMVRLIDHWAERVTDGRRRRGLVLAATGPKTLQVQVGDGPMAATLAGVACPEAWEGDAIAWLERHCAKEAVMLVRPTDGTTILTDIGWLVYTDAGRFVNEAMIDQGFAVADSPGHDLSAWFAQLAEWAERKKRGCWSDIAGR
jgi:hypothetical protein